MKNKYGINSGKFELIVKLIGLIYPENEKTGGCIFNRRTMEKRLIGCDFPAEIWDDAINMVEGAIQDGLDRESFQGMFETFFVAPLINQPLTAVKVRRNFRKKVLEFIISEKAKQEIRRKLEKAEAESAGARPEGAPLP